MMINRYRRILKRQKERHEQKQAEQEEENLDQLDPEELKARIDQAEKDYIKERITLRHKNQSRWVKKSMQHAHHNPSLRSAIQEQLEIADKIKKRQTQLRNADDYEEEVIADKILNQDAHVFDELREEVKEEQQAEESGLFAMKFMRNAREKKAQQQLELIQQMEAEVNQALGIPTEPNSQQQTEQQSKKQQNRMGRRIFQATHTNDESKEEGETNAKVQLQGKSWEVQKQMKVSVDGSIAVAAADTQNSILNNTPIETKSSIASTTTTTIPNGNNKLVPASNMKKRKRVERTASRANPWLTTEDQEKDTRMSKKQRKDKSADDSEIRVQLNVEHIQQENDQKQQENEFLQQVKKQAFAGDDLELEFKQAKEKVLDEEIDLPDLQSAQLPGWGTWAGKGTNYKDNMAKQQERLDKIKQDLREEKASERPDKEKHHVIIRSSAAVPDKYLNARVNVNDTQRKIYDNTVAHPLGMEWNSVTGFMSSVAPRAQKKAGVVIQPLSYKAVQHLTVSRDTHPRARGGDAAAEQATKEEADARRLQRQQKRLETDIAKERAIQAKIEREKRMIVI